MPIMIKPPGLPVSGGVTGLALRRSAKRALVVIVGMAGRTGRSLDREGLVGMAAGAGHLGMFAQQREAGQVMIEPNLDQPASGAVTASAFGAESGLVDIVLEVARRTLAVQLELAGWPGVACLAPRGGVLVGQRESGHRVVIEVD